jgi:hypothetical protein
MLDVKPWEVIEAALAEYFERQYDGYRQGNKLRSNQIRELSDNPTQSDYPGTDSPNRYDKREN